MSKNFFLVIILIVIISSNLFSQNFWKRIKSPTDAFLRTLHFTDSLKGWVAGDSGLIFYTSDGGINWTEQQTGSMNRIMKLFFLDEMRGHAISWQDKEPSGFLGTYLLETTDGGLNWTSEQYRDENVFMRAIYFLDTLKGFMGGEPGVFVTTSDGGLNWVDANIDSGTFSHFPVKNFDFYNDEYGYASGGRFDIAGVIWRTTNGGNNWTPIDPQFSPPDEVWDIHFFDSLNVMGVGGDPDFFGVGTITSTDAGNSWEYFEIGVSGIARAISFRTEDEGWCVVPLSENFVATFDYGKSWTTYQDVDSSALYDITFTDSLTGYAVGQDGVILKYKYQKPSSVKSETNVPVNDFILYQNYPNPFNSSTTISYSIESAGKVSLKIYNELGMLIDNLSDDYHQIGDYDIKWNSGDHPSGIYLIQLRLDSKLQARKMILLK